jgi:hypothetical protein
MRKRKTQKIKNTIMTILIALLLTTSMSAIFVFTPTTEAHEPAWNIPTFAYITVAPNPVGVGQQVLAVFWLDKLFDGSSMTNNYRFHNYQLTITAPDGKVQKETFDTISDTTSSQYMPYTPTQIGTYTFNFTFPGQAIKAYSYNPTSAYVNDTYLPSSASTTLTVQQEQLIPPVASYPLPTEYWTRPIEGQNTYWDTIASNWLGDKDFSSAGSPQIKTDFMPDGTAPNSPHIMWTKWLGDGGIVGGNNTGIQGNMFYSGSSYEQRMSKPIIMNGRLSYQMPYGNAAAGGKVECVDLRTGETLWTYNSTGIGVPAFGYYYDYETPNQHGIIPNGWLFSSNFAKAIDPKTGIAATLNITNVPSGYEVLGPSGEHLRYQLTVANKWLAQWNSSKVFSTQTSGSFSANATSCYDWNVTLPWLMAGATTIAVFRDDILLGRNGSLPTVSSQGPYTMWAVSLKPQSLGQLLWMKNYNPPPSNITLNQGPVDEGTRVFAFAYKETMQWIGFSLDTGEPLWGPTEPQGAYDYYQFAMTGVDYGKLAYGNLYSCAYAGIAYCYEMKSGTLLWTYGNGGPGNDTTAGLSAPWPNWPMQIFAICDNKIYLLSGEHSANTPLYKDELVRCIDALTGKEIWTIMGYGGYRTRANVAIADGSLVYFNLYDSQIYCFGKGPSSLTVTAPNIASQFGEPLVIRGIVTDISAGTKQNEQAARFPNGVPAVSDESQKSWMEYVYMQKPKPTNATGVPVSIDVVDSNGNTRNIGTATSDSSGMFSFTWTPDIEGTFYVIARFVGSESYWPSSAETSFVVNSPVSTPSPHPVSILPPTEMYFAISTAAIIIAIAIGFAITIMVLKKRQ